MAGINQFITQAEFVIADLDPNRKRMSISFALQTPVGNTPGTYVLNGFPMEGVQAILNPQSVATVKAWDGSRSLQGAIRLGSTDYSGGLQQPRGLFAISVQGTNQVFFFGSKFAQAAIDPSEVKNRAEFIDFCVPIYANNTSQIVFTFGQNVDGVTGNVFLSGNLNNFELPPYFSQTYVDYNTAP